MTNHAGIDEVDDKIVRPPRDDAAKNVVRNVCSTSVLSDLGR